MADVTPTETNEAKAKFSKALSEARAGAEAFGKDAQKRAGLYKDKLSESGAEWLDEARTKGAQAKEKATELANDGKHRASNAIAGLSKIVADNAGTIDNKLGAKYGDYARSAAKSMQEAADKIETKDLNELSEEAKELIRKSPGVAVALAAVGGFMLARLFKGSDN